MTFDRIDASLPVPTAVARSLVVQGKHTARDLAYALTAAAMAGQRDEAEDGKDLMIGDNAFRYALGLSRSDTQDVENSRVFRMRAARIAVDGQYAPVAMPTLPIVFWSSDSYMVHRKGIRVAGDAQQQWQVDQNLAAAMRAEGDEMVELPFALVQGAKHKSSVIVMLRLLAWIADAPAEWVKSRENRWQDDLYIGGRLVLDIPPTAIMDSLGLPAKSKPAIMMARMLEPAALEITRLTGYVVRFTELRTVYRPDATGAVREGRLQAIRVEIDIPTMIARPARPVARVPGKAWQPKPKFHKPAKPAALPPAIVDNVVILPDDDDDDDSLFGLPIPSGRIARPVPVSPEAKPGVVRTFRRNT